MKIQGTHGGIVVRLNKGDAQEDVKNQLEAQQKVLKSCIFIDVEDEVSWKIIQTASEIIAKAGGTINTVRAAIGKGEASG